ncbi:MAG: hypothetical protein GZ088_15000 [Acidipila sp.]|nr:hypothetical protein [Acidipila sp.]
MRTRIIAKPFQSSRGPAWILLAWLPALLLLAGPRAFAQQDAEAQGVDSGNYNIKQSAEIGYRFTDFSGDRQAYDSMINLQQGPRLLNFTVEMRSLNHQGMLFDRFYITNYGYGGDPNDVSRLRISKDKWYNFDTTFRRDQSFFDYSLLANPLNPVTPAFANAPAGFTPVIGSSPHLFATVRHLSDYNLTLLPQSRVRFRLGFSRSATQGPAFTTLHQGTEALLLQDVSTTGDTYRVGFDFRMAPRTSFSYDQFFSYYKGDTGITDQHQLFTLANGVPVDIGVSLNASANQPCGGTFLVAPPSAVNPTCNGFLSYTQHGRSRTRIPTEQFSFQSNYFQRLDLSGRFSYSGGDVKVSGWNSNFNGLESRTSLRNATTSGPVLGRHVTASGDFGATLHVTDKLSFLETFHYSNFHNPVAFDSTLCQFFGAPSSLLTAPTMFTSIGTLPAKCTAPAGAAAGTPTHGGSSGPDITVGTTSRLLTMDSKTNLVELDYRFSQRFGARLGYRYRARSIGERDTDTATFVFFPTKQNARSPLAPFSSVTCPVANNLADLTCIVTPAPFIDSSNIPINEHSAVLGLWARPVQNFRISFDTELRSADNSFTRISPRQLQEYRIRSSYKPVAWMNVSGSVNILESRNNVTDVNNLQHTRGYGFSASFDPNQKFSLELGYDYSDIFSQIQICYTATPKPRGLNACPGGTGLGEQLSTYTNKSHFGYFDLTFTPFKRLTTRVGTNMTGTTGSALNVNPLAPSGTLNSNFYKPYGGFELVIVKGVTGKAYWNYYGYHEDMNSVPQDLFAPRNYRGNMATLSVRYAF